MVESYMKWDPAFDIKASESAFLIIDMQKGFTDGGPLSVPMAKEQIPQINKFAEYCRGKGIPVLYSKFFFDKDNTYDFYYKMAPARGLQNADGTMMFSKADPQYEISEGLTPKASDIVFDKFGYDCFGHTNLEDTLNQLGVKTLIIAGTVVNWCVDSIIRSAYHKDYNVVVAADGVSGYDYAGITGEQWQSIELELFAEAFARVSTIDDLISELEG